MAADSARYRASASEDALLFRLRRHAVSRGSRDATSDTSAQLAGLQTKGGGKRDDVLAQRVKELDPVDPGGEAPGSICWSF